MTKQQLMIVEEAIVTRYKFCRTAFKLCMECWTESDYIRGRIFKQKEIRHILDRISLNPGARVLDVGIGEGEIVYALRALGYEVVGIDDDEGGKQTQTSLEGLFPDCSVICLPLEEVRWPIEDASFDAVICTQVIEHMPISPGSILREMRRVLKPGGMLYVSNPNPVRAHFRARAMFGRSPYPVPIDRYYAGFGSPEYVYHIREFTAEELAYMLDQAAFEVLLSGYCNLLYLRHAGVARGRLHACVSAPFPKMKDCSFAVGQR